MGDLSLNTNQTPSNSLDWSEQGELVMLPPMFKPQKIFSESQEPKRKTWVFAVPFLAIVFLIAGQLITLVPVFEMGIIPEEELETYPNIIYMLFAPFLAVVLFTWLWTRFFEGRTFASVGMYNDGQPVRHYLHGYGYGLLMSLIIVCSVWGLQGYERDTDAMFQLNDFVPLLILMLGFAVQSGAEEYLFRGWLFSRIAERYGVFIGIAVNTLFFTLMHLLSEDFLNGSTQMQLLNIITLVLFSVFMSIMVVKQKSIWGAAAWHAGWNWFFINGFGLATTGIELNINPIFVDLKMVESAPLWLTGGSDGPESSVITVVVLIVASVLVVKNKILK